jgi:tetratricopeptide (TPR) repeat protein
MSRGRGAAAALAVTLGLVALWAGGALSRSARAPADAGADSAAAAARARVVAFWQAYREATELRLESRLAEAAAAYERALAFNPRHEDALYYLGHVRLERGEFAAAERAWRRLTEINPASARAHLQLGTLYLCFADGAPTDLRRAAAEFHRAHEINKEETGAVLRLGEIALARQDPATATERFSAVLGSNPGSVPAHFYLGYLAWQAGRPAEALGGFRRAAELARTRPITAAPSEGDTKRGLAPLVAARSRCRDLEDPAAALDAVADAAVEHELDRRYAALRALLAEARRRDARPGASGS